MDGSGGTPCRPFPRMELAVACAWSDGGASLFAAGCSISPSKQHEEWTDLAPSSEQAPPLSSSSHFGSSSLAQPRLSPTFAPGVVEPCCVGLYLGAVAFPLSCLWATFVGTGSRVSSHWMMPPPPHGRRDRQAGSRASSPPVLGSSPVFVAVLDCSCSGLTAPSLEWPVETVRQTFFSYFGENQHARLSSTPVIPVDDPKLPLIRMCLNWFKGTLNGRGRHRTCFSLRCIIASGDDDVIDHFRSDTTYHRFTEILGSWSFGDYFKEEAIGLSFSLLSKCAGPGIEDYSNKIGAADTDGVDMAYRLLADHIRMIAVTNAPGSQLVLKTNQEDYDVYGIRNSHLIWEKKKKKKKDVTAVVWYATRVIEFLGRRTPIILKNKDTRCSLVALCNVLLLGEKITLNLDIKKFEDKIYVLLNDLSLFGAETDAVWERLTQANGDGLFVDCDFVPTDSKIQSVLPLTKSERKKRNKKETMGLKGLLVPKEKERRGIKKRRWV
ncbi:hypothetical protein SETIT_2G150400v2 [Setaria italica]|uniref:alanine--tRNA ligase n=1 Tax=Setaria italica TaxID=4555 RepID=A0A368PYV4_SETIT|nr:hypothetical protein SETIT_2G150400v2 [Setaria italica]